MSGPTSMRDVPVQELRARVRAGDRARMEQRRRRVGVLSSSSSTAAATAISLDTLIAWNAARYAGQQARAELTRRRRNAARRAATAARNASRG